MNLIDMIKTRGNKQGSGKTAKDRLMSTKINNEDLCRVSEVKRSVYSKLLEIGSLNPEDIVITSNYKDINISILNVH